VIAFLAALITVRFTYSFQNTTSAYRISSNRCRVSNTSRVSNRSRGSKG